MGRGVGALRPSLTTDRIRLEPLTEAHVELLVELNSDPAVLELIYGRALSRQETVESDAPRRLRSDARGRGSWMGYDATGDWLGWWCLAVDDEDPDAAELGYRLRRSAWGAGHATEGSRALLSHGFGELGLARIWAETMAVNTRSRHVMEKLGMRLVRTEVRSWDHPLPGAELGEVVYEVTQPPSG